MGIRQLINRLFTRHLIRMREPRIDTVALVLCDAITPSVRNEFARIRAGGQLLAECKLLFHAKDPANAPDSRLPCSVFTDQALSNLPYRWLSPHQIIPGSTHFPLMHFGVHNRDYNYYWLIEADVKFSGNWKHLFQAFSRRTEDFVTCCLRNYSDDPDWYWWHSLSHSSEEIPLHGRIGSFNPVYRISRRGVDYLHSKLSDGWMGHFEVVAPTLLAHAGYSLSDFGGTGKFVQAGNQNRFYTDQTMRFRPVFRKVGRQKNKLYHPVKG